MTAPEFKIGDVVTLKIESPEMVVTDICAHGSSGQGTVTFVTADWLSVAIGAKQSITMPAACFAARMAPPAQVPATEEPSPVWCLRCVHPEVMHGVHGCTAKLCPCGTVPARLLERLGTKP